MSLLQLEESLVHEFGHQVLYEVMAWEPLLADGGRGDYRLPWSGSHRDFYGYFHAFYIYLLLARYLERALSGGAHEPGEVRPLLDHIVSGLVEARDDLVADERFTPTGARMITALMCELDGLTARLERAPEPVA